MRDARRVGLICLAIAAGATAVMHWGCLRTIKWPTESPSPSNQPTSPLPSPDATGMPSSSPTISPSPSATPDTKESPAPSQFPTTPPAVRTVELRYTLRKTDMPQNAYSMWTLTDQWGRRLCCAALPDWELPVLIQSNGVVQMYQNDLDALPQGWMTLQFEMEAAR